MLTINRLDLDIRSEQIRLIYRQGPIMVLGATLIAIVLVGLLWHHVSHDRLLWWLFGIAFSAGVRTLVFHSFKQHGVQSPGTGLWGFLFWFGSCLAGCVWGALPLVLYTGVATEYLLLISTIFAGMVAVTASAGSIYLPSFYSFSIPLVLPLAVLHLLSGIDYLFVTGAMLLLFLLVNVLLARRGNRQYVELITARFRNADLMDKLSAEKSIAEKAVLAKNRFLAAASHDLRQPLHALGLFIGSLRKRANNRESLDIIGDMEASTTALGQLLHSLLDISRLEAGVVSVEKTQVTLDQITKNLVTEFRPLAVQKNLTLSCERTDVSIYTDVVLLERILRNLLSNAIRYTQAGGVYIDVRPHNAGSIVLVVGDTGVGIPMHEQKSVYSEYHQIKSGQHHVADSSNTNNATVMSGADQGMGLGLSIVDQLCQLMKVPLSMQSEPGKGTEFMLELPAATVVKTSVASALSGQVELNGKVVMVVDDEPQVLEAMSARLSDWGCYVISATSAKSALFQLAMSEYEPDLLLCDYRLGLHETGLDVINAVRESTNRHIPAVIVTGDTAPERLQEVAASDLIFLYKPVADLKLKTALISRLSETAIQA